MIYINRVGDGHEGAHCGPRDFRIGTIDNRLYGAFLEHLGRAVYSGIYEPGHPTADEDGFRGDVLELVRGSEAPVVRYPGGNFVSAYNWEDGIGPQGPAPGAARLAWSTTETNQVGTDEFIRWCRKAGTETMLAVNLGSQGLHRSARHARILQPSRAAATGATCAARTARTEPYNVKALVPRQRDGRALADGHRTADEYGRIANEVGRGMKVFDPTLELVVCGSSHANMPTYPDWEAEVLDEPTTMSTTSRCTCIATTGTTTT